MSASGVSVQGTFVSEKVSVVRWVGGGSECAGSGESDSFLTAGWDNDDVGNLVRLWRLEQPADESEELVGEERGPVCVAAWRNGGGIAGLSVISSRLAAAATSRGQLVLFSLPGPQLHSHLNSPQPAQLKPAHIWDKLHTFQDGTASACTGLAVMDGDMATVGEDGRMNLLTCHQPQIIRTIENADSCTLRCICFLKHNEVITGNLRGQMKIWDLRSSSDNPSSTFLFSGEQMAVTSVVHHPTQRHLVLAGSENGSIAVWDLRVNTYPASFLNAHSATVNEIQFHPDHPQRLFTCSANGEIWHWNTAAMSKQITSTANSLSVNESAINPWLMNDEDRSNLEIVPLMSDLHKSINSLDCNKNRVICGCDNEAIYIINNIFP